MEARAVFAATTAERLDIAALLESLDDGQLGTPSLCAGWDTLTVGAHLAVAVSTTFAVFMAAVIKHGGNVNRANDRLARKMARRPVAEVADILRLSADLHLAPARTGPLAALTDVMIHAGDIRRPLNLPHDPPGERVCAALEFLAGPRTVGFVRRHSIEGLQIVAEDVGFVAGSGEQVRGRGTDLMMAISGRRTALRDLHGPGVKALQSRLA